MTLEEVPVQQNNSIEKARRTGEALQEALESAQANDCLTIGVYESAKVMNVDPDSVAFCVLAMDEEFECDIALQIHFTLIQAFCFDNDISIVRVSDAQRLAELLGDKAGQLEDAHCVLITNPTDGSWEDPALEKLHVFCSESRSCHEWVPEVTLPAR
ncbi:growth arrest and DNA damage-inducible protein GADD45 gamma-like [Astyanax mexicanus]|uniref:growth arrest and DNA damage-inducible protein GADD45 gamma-like n=1 Tax=Astyanax mexicanus TaxID=7994 RepID=UPI0020CB60C9|nr:growth arrest and DNA damage-inducible protein GADD45 gamma-like [Astyanax mexicanus]